MRWILIGLIVGSTACAASEPEPAHEETSGEEVEAGPRLSESPPEEQPEPPSEVACTRVDLLTVTVPRAVYDTRHGHDVAQFSALETSQEKPLEECGLQSVLSRLVTLQCDDGSSAFPGGPGQAHSSRVGNTGPGGRCGAIIDLYRAQCGATTYDVYADMYFCPGS